MAEAGIRPWFLNVIFLLFLEHLFTQGCYFANTGEEGEYLENKCGLCGEGSAAAVAQLEKFSTQSQEI